MAVLATVTLDNTIGPLQTNQTVFIPLSASNFPFASLNGDGRNLDVLDSDGVTSLAHTLRDWSTGLGLTLASVFPLPQSGFGHAYKSATKLAFGNLGLANPPHLLAGVGAINDPDVSYGQWDLYDRLGNHVWSFTSPSQDYPMGAYIGDLAGDGSDPVALCSARFSDHAGYVLNPNGTTRWSYVFASVPGLGFPYIRIARIGKLRNDLTGNQVLFGGAYGQLALLDKLGNLLWLKTFAGVEQNITCQDALIVDLTSSGQNSIFFPQSEKLRKLDNAGNVLWTYANQATPDPGSYCYQLAAGHFTSLTSKQIVACWQSGAIGGATAYALSAITVLDDSGNLLWQKVIPFPLFSVTAGDLNGDGYDEIIVSYGFGTGYGSAANGSAGMLVFDGNGRELACQSPFGSTDLEFADSDGSGRKRISMVSGFDVVTYDYGITGASVKVTIPTLPAGTIKLLSLASSANVTLIPPLGDFWFNATGANGSSPPGMTPYLDTWTVQGGTFQSQDDGDTAAFGALEATGLSTDGFELEFTGQKIGQGTGTSNYYMGCRYRCNTWSAGLPNGFLLQSRQDGTVQLVQSASGSGATVQILFSAVTGLTFNTTDLITYRLTVAGINHAASYRKNGGPWTLLYRVQDAAATPLTSAGTVALFNQRGQVQYSAITLHAIPGIYTVFGAQGPGPRVTVQKAASPAASVLWLENGNRLWLENGSGILLAAVAFNPSTFFLATEDGSHFLKENGTAALLAENGSSVVESFFGVKPFGSTAFATVDPFGSTARLKGN